MSRDLAIVVADKSMGEAIQGILTRPEAVGMRRINSPTVVVHPNHDPGVWKSGHELLSVYERDHAHGLMLLDHAWEGNPHKEPLALAEEIEDKCRPAWGDRARCIVITPELEVWAWARSPHVARTLKWESDRALRGWLRAQGFVEEGETKPQDPKRAYEAALREKRARKSAALFRELAEKVAFGSCEDTAFRTLLGLLRTWFPP